MCCAIGGGFTGLIIVIRMMINEQEEYFEYGKGGLVPSRHFYRGIVQTSLTTHFPFDDANTGTQLPIFIER